MNIGFCQYRNYAGQSYAEPDLLIWENDTIKIQTFPLNGLSKFDQKNLFDNKEVKPDCWGCLKNYTDVWKITNGKLYLSNIYSFNFKKDRIKTDLNKLFPDKIKNNLVLADWYSGNLFVPKGQLVVTTKSKVVSTSNGPISSVCITSPQSFLTVIVKTTPEGIIPPV